MARCQALGHAQEGKDLEEMGEVFFFFFLKTSRLFGVKMEL